MKLLALLVIGNVLTGICCESGPIVEAPAGKFQGHVLKTRNGQDILSFEGIPYAMPPVDQLRFMDPVRMPKLEGVYDATNGMKDCFQPTMNFSQISDVSSYIGSEDCLYLNVHKPKVAEGTGPLPVMVWVHGGGFFMGSGSLDWFSPEFLLDKDMIYVSINYRLGILGFLFDSENGVSGNFGMKDQVMALKWVQENIGAFGGDPNMVTLAGHSAGGAAVSLHMHSPLSKGLFHKVMALSGTAFSSFGSHPEELAVSVFTSDVINQLGCSSTPGRLLRCLQKMPLKELIKTSVSLIPQELQFSFDFIPVVERPSPDAFITEESLSEPSTLPLMVGVTSLEAVNMFPVFTGFKKYQHDEAKILQDVEQLIPLWGGFSHALNRDDLTQQITHFYFGEAADPSPTIPHVIDYISDIMFNHGAHKAATTEKGPVYLYQFSYQGHYTRPSTPTGIQGGVGHGEDLRYPLKMLVDPTHKWSDQDLAMSHTMVDLWFNFLKHGDPTPDDKKWEESSKGVKYLDISNDGLVMKSDMFKERMEFLDHLDVKTSGMVGSAAPQVRQAIPIATPWRW